MPDREKDRPEAGPLYGGPAFPFIPGHASEVLQIDPLEPAFRPPAREERDDGVDGSRAGQR